MAADLINAISAHKDIFDQFSKNPLDAIKALEAKTGVSFGKVNVDDIEILRTMNFDEIQLLAAIQHKIRKGGKPFKLG
ncbi:hypothetical protein ACJJJB_21180 [Microbulbifer sp. ANSA001]|uniref:hypothetical protein n=1 Tax=Microbulbifer sp. ANSA001 TaxID=3243358 RepID=UPI00404123E6